MDENKKSIPVISLIFAICGFLLMMNANVEKVAMIKGGLFAGIISFVLALYSVFKIDYKKWCAIISIILCIITFITYTLF